MEWNGLSGIPSGLGDGDDDSLATTSCNSGQVLKYIGSSWTCAEDAGGTDYTAGYGLVLNVSEFSVLSDTIQTRVNNNCPPDQSIREIKADGSVVCETDDNTIYTQGYGLDLVAGQFSVDTGEVQNRVTGTCIAGQSIRIINANGSVTCENDDNTIYSPGYGLDLVTGQFSVDTAEVQDRVDGVCPAGQSIRQINQDGSVVCEPDADTVDGYEGAALEESAEIDADIVRTRP
jgi:hypothetical protein